MLKEKVPDSLDKMAGLSVDERTESLVEQMRTAATSGEAVNMSIPGHEVITRALYKLAHESQPVGNRKVKITYNDQSKGKPFPIGLLFERDWRWRPENALHVGTLSFRHLNYDPIIDTYLIRDRETRRLFDRDIEDKAFKKMKNILESKEFEDGGHIVLFQTGLEPLVVGAWRAIILHLNFRNREKRPPLVILPVFYVNNNGKWKEGPIWGGGQ